MGRGGTLAAVLALMGLVVLGAGGRAQAGSAIVEDVRALDDVNRFGGTCGVNAPAGFFPRDTATEATLAVNPVDPQNIAVAWIQDFPAGITVASTTNGGRAWRTVAVPQLSRCTGSPDEGAADPWLSFGADGTLYLSAMSLDLPLPGTVAPDVRIVVSRSADGGQQWSSPSEVEPKNGWNDKPVMAADSTRPGRLYVVWTKRIGVVGEHSPGQYVARSDDGGRSWTPRQPVYEPPRAGVGARPIPSGISVLPDRSVLFAYLMEHSENALPGVPQDDPEIAVVRSTDGGVTWEGPQVLGETHEQVPNDPDGGAEGEFEPIASLATAADGTAYVAWQDIESATSSRIMLAKSTTGGRTWSPPRVAVTSKAQAFQPTISAKPGGEVGLTWGDTRNDRRGDGKFTANMFFAHSHDRGGSWDPTPLAGPFDIRTAWPDAIAPVPGFYFLGDYAGLAPSNDGFKAAFIQAHPPARSGYSDPFFASVALPGEKCLSRRSPIGRRNIGRIRLGYTRARLGRVRVRAPRRTRRSYSYCVRRSRGRVTAVFSSRSARGRVRLVTTTAARHGNRRVRTGSRASRFRRAYPNRRRVGRGLYRAGPRSPRIFGVRRGRVSFVGVADRRVLRNRRVLRRYLRLAGVGR